MQLYNQEIVLIQYISNSPLCKFLGLFSKESRTFSTHWTEKNLGGNSEHLLIL